MKNKSYWIKKRYNPQLEKPYFLACGQLSKTSAKKREGTLYGFNVMLEYETEKEYKEALDKFESDGYRVSRSWTTASLKT